MGDDEQRAGGAHQAALEGALRLLTSVMGAASAELLLERSRQAAGARQGDGAGPAPAAQLQTLLHNVLRLTGDVLRQDLEDLLQKSDLDPVSVMQEQLESGSLPDDRS